MGSMKYDEHWLLDAAIDASNGLSGREGAAAAAVGAAVTFSSALLLVYENACCPGPG